MTPENMNTAILVIQGITTFVLTMAIRPLLKLEHRLTRIETALERFERCDICPYKGPTLPQQSPRP